MTQTEQVKTTTKLPARKRNPSKGRGSRAQENHGKRVEFRRRIGQKANSNTY